MDITIGPIGNLSQLEELKIYSRTDFHLDVVLLVQRLHKLDQLHTVGRVRINLEIYRKIVDVVQQRPDMTKLTFRVITHDDYDELRNVFALNAHLVEMIFVGIANGN